MPVLSAIRVICVIRGCFPEKITPQDARTSYALRRQLLCHLQYQPLRGLPIDARVGDRLAVDQRIQGPRKRLLAGQQVAFQHGAEHRRGAGGPQAGDVPQDFRLPAGVFAAVAVAAVDQNRLIQSRLRQQPFGFGDMFGGVIRPVVAAAQDDVAVRDCRWSRRPKPLRRR